MPDVRLQHYDAVLADIQQQNSKLKHEIESLTQQLERLLVAESSVLGLRPMVVGTAEVRKPELQPLFVQESVTDEPLYKGLSTRWSILWLLCEHTTNPLGRAQIAERLKENGIGTSGKDFLSNVSAILSQMSSKGEVTQTAEGWNVTDLGREIWAGIKQSRKFQERLQRAA